MPSLCKHHLDTADAKRPKHYLNTSRKPPKPQAKKLFHVTFGIHIKQSLAPQSTCPAYANTSLCKHHLDTADAKRPKHHLDTSRKPPKPQAKKLFHVTFGLHIKQSLEPQSTCPAYANTIWNHIKQLWSHRAHAQPMQTPSGHCRCKKTQTPSRHEPKTAQTASQKTVSRYLWNPHKTIFGATEHMPSLCKHHLEPHKTTLEPQHMPSLCKHHLDTADAKRPKHHLDTSRKPPKPQAKKLFHVTFGIHINKTKTI